MRLLKVQLTLYWQYIRSSVNLIAYSKLYFRYLTPESVLSLSGKGRDTLGITGKQGAGRLSDSCSIQ